MGKLRADELAVQSDDFKQAVQREELERTDFVFFTNSFGITSEVLRRKAMQDPEYIKGNATISEVDPEIVKKQQEEAEAEISALRAEVEALKKGKKSS